MSPTPQGLEELKEKAPKMLRLLHVCGEAFEADVFDSHGEVIFDPPECPSCGQVLTDAETKPYERGDQAVMNFQQAQQTIANYACSSCWSHLVSYPFAADKTRVLCPTCGEETRGYVSKHYVARLRAKSMAHKVEAAYVLRDIIPSPHKGKSEEQLLKELGY